jgi:hypothetical protein
MPTGTMVRRARPSPFDITPADVDTWRLPGTERTRSRALLRWNAGERLERDALDCRFRAEQQ